MRERHPVPDAPALPLDQRVHLLECRLAQLWDEVWWHQLPFYRRWWWALPRIAWDPSTRRLRWWGGHRSPIRRFYVPASDRTPDRDLRL